MTNVLFSRNPSELLNPGEACDPDVWDDTLLIEAYEKAVNPIKIAIANKLDESEGKLTTKSASTKDWTVGLPVRALYSEDQKYYEGNIVKVFRDACLIKFLGYNNKEMVSKKNLKKSLGENSRIKQIQDAQAEANIINKCSETSEDETDVSNEFDSSKPCINECLSKKASSTNLSFSLPSMPGGISMIPPPIPPHVMSQFPQSESELLSSMLMSWYMSGYHTGYWQGYKSSEKRIEARTTKKRGRCC